jgi:hypothetical protein
MLRSFIFFLTFLSIASNAEGQSYKLNQRYPGYFINAKGDTIRGYILLTNKWDNQRGGEYSNDSRGEKIKIHLLPDEVKGFKVQDRIYSAVDYGEADPLYMHFLLTLEQGQLNLYQYFRLSKDLYISEGNGQRPADGNDEQYLQSEFIIINKEGKKFVIPNQSALTKNAEEIFKGNTELIQKIKDKEKDFHYANLQEMIKQYNDSILH